MTRSQLIIILSSNRLTATPAEMSSTVKQAARSVDVVKITRGSTTGPTNFPQAVAQSNLLLHQPIAILLLFA